MRIGVDAATWSNRRGYGRFTRALLTAALRLDRENEYTFFVDDPSDEFPLPSTVNVVRVNAGVPTVQAAAAQGSRSLGDMWRMSRALSAADADLFFFPSVYSYVPVTHRAPKLVGIHDVIAEVFPELTLPSARARLFWRAKVKMGLAQARLVLTVSEYSRRKLSEVLKIPASRLRVVSEAGDPVFRRLPPGCDAPALRRMGLSPGDRYLIYVGGISPHKNLGLLVDVFAELAAQPDLGDVRLLLVGDYQGDVFHSCYKELSASVRAHGLDQRVTFTGYMGDAELVEVLNHAQALALPSFCEGFGLPAVEAAACGAPVVVTTESPLPELLGAGAIGLAPDDRNGWRDALASLLRDPGRRRRMSEAALAAAAKLSWDNSARQLLEVFDEMKGRHG